MNILERKLRKLVRGALIEHEMSLDTLVKPVVSGDGACTDCKGTGKYVPAFGAIRGCDTCGGTGDKMVTPLPPASDEEFFDDMDDDEARHEIEKVHWERENTPIPRSNPRDRKRMAHEKRIADLQARAAAAASRRMTHPIR